MNNIFKKRVIDLMEEHNEKQLALAAAINVTQATLSRNLNGVHVPKIEVVEKIAEHYNVSVDYLIGKSNERKEFTTVADSVIKLKALGLLDNLSDADLIEVINYINYVKSKKDLK